MPTEFRKSLCVSTFTSRLPRENFLLERYSWKDIGRVKNLSDYDRICLNLTALAEMRETVVFDGRDMQTIFDPRAWSEVLAARGHIYLVGDPRFSVRIGTRGKNEPCAEVNPEADLDRQVLGLDNVKPLEGILTLALDERVLDYRRVEQSNRSVFETIYKYLDGVSGWNYSIWRLSLSKDFRDALETQCGPPDCQLFGATSYGTHLACRVEFRSGGWLTILPPSNAGTEKEDLFVLQKFFGVATTLPEPDWVGGLKLPGQHQIERAILAEQQQLQDVQNAIIREEAQLSNCKRWYRLLYDDGDSLEGIVKEGLELLGARVEKLSVEKDDFRVKFPGYLDGVMEIKGTHNPQFGRGALRQLAGWMDEVIAADSIEVKGIFVGNSNRTEDPSTRGTLFETNSAGFAVIRGIVVLRSMDLYCLVILKLLNVLDTTAFWQEFYACKGAFDSTRHWGLLPEEFRLSSKQ